MAILHIDQSRVHLCIWSSSISPLHTGLLVHLLLGPSPLQCGSLLVAGRLITTVHAVTLLLSVGHGLLLGMDKNSSHRTGLDLLAASALLGMGIKELLHKADGAAEPPGWTHKLDQFSPMPRLLPYRQYTLPLVST